MTGNVSITEHKLYILAPLENSCLPLNKKSIFLMDNENGYQ